RNFSSITDLICCRSNAHDGWQHIELLDRSLGAGVKNLSHRASRNMGAAWLIPCDSRTADLAHRLRRYLALHEGADALDGRSRARKDPRPDLPSVRHPRPYFEFDLTSGSAHPLRHAHGIIEEDLVAADLDERRRQSGRVGVKRRRIRRARIGAGEIIARE